MERSPDPLTIDQLTEEEFSRLHVLRRVSLESVWGLLERCAVVLLDEGDPLISKGQVNRLMYMVLDGELSVLLEENATDVVARLGRGETVGEISVIDDFPATAFVRATRATSLLEVDEDTFWSLVEVSHEFAANMLLLFAQRMRASNHRISEDVRLRRRLELEATVDALTGLRNRRWLDNNLSRLVERHRRGGVPMGLLMFDIDHFKRFNDDFGHQAGDMVLTAEARVLMNRLRPTDLAARYGGEEFCAILPDTDQEGAMVAAERLREAVESTSVAGPDGEVLPRVTVSIGVASLAPEDTPATLIARADAALYQAKESGRNRVVGPA